MDKLRKIHALKVAEPGDRNFIDYLTGAARTTLRQWPRTCQAVLWTLAASLPMYSMEYHEGRLPVIGFLVSTGIGAILVTMLVKHRTVDKKSGDTDSPVWGSAAKLAATTVASGFVLYWLMQTAVSLLDGMPVEVVEIVRNSNNYGWKPISHVALGSVMIFAIAPALLVGIPLMLRHRLGLAEAFLMVARRAEDRHYRWAAAMTVLVAIGGVMVFLPYACLLVPALVANLSDSLYREIFSAG